MNNQIVRFRITGLSPLMLKKMVNDDLSDSGEASVKKKIDPAEEAERAAHRLPSTNGHKGQLAITAEGFRYGLLYAAPEYKFGKLRGPRVIQSSVGTTQDLVGLIDPESKEPIYEYEIDGRPFVNRTTKGRMMTYRPKINKWECIVELEIDLDLLPDPKQLLPIFNKAGVISGAGSFRPQKKGPFGKYMVEMVD